MQQYSAIASTFFDRAACSVEGGGTCFHGCLGVRDLSSGNIGTYMQSPNTFVEAMKHDVEQYLSNYELYSSPPSGRLMSGTPHSIVGVKTGGVVVACWSLADQKCNEAIAVGYGLFHTLHAAYKSVDEEFCDMLLLRVGEWEKQNPPNTGKALSLVQRIFKPELLV